MGNSNEKAKQELLMDLAAHYDLLVAVDVAVVNERSPVYVLVRSKDP